VRWFGGSHLGFPPKNILVFLGRLRERLVWLVYFSLGLCLVYSLFYVASYFGLSFFVLSNRGMVEHVVSGSMVSVPWDVGVWSCFVFVVLAWLFYRLGSSLVGWFRRLFAGFVLFGLVVWVCLVIFGVVGLVSLVLVSALIMALSVVFSFDFFGVSRFDLFLRLLVGAVLAALFFEVAALVLFNVPVALNLGSGAVGLHWGNVELSFSNLAYPFLPYVYLLFVLLGIAAFAIKLAPAEMLVSKIRDKRFGELLHRLSNMFQLSSRNEFEFLSGRFVLFLAVVVSAVVSCLFVVFTVLPWANPTHMLVSADSPDYYKWIVYMRSVNVNGALSFAFANDRALFLVLAYVLSFVVSPLAVVQYVAALLIVVFSVVSLLVLRSLCSLRAVWVFGVLLVPFSFQSLGLIYSGYFANMLALILVLVYLILFFRVLSSWSSFGFFALLGVSVLILFSHSWTWFVFALSLVAFLLWEWRLAVRDKGLWSRFKLKATFVVATIGVGLFCDFIRRFLSPVSSAASVFSTAQSSLSIPNGAYLLNQLRQTVDFVLGGVFANQLLVFLSVVGFLYLLKFKSEVSNFFVSWIFVACASILFAAQDFVFDRFLFLMPWIVLSSLGLFGVVRLVGSRFRGGKGRRFCVALLVLVFVFLVLLNGSLRYIFNINIW
jgi:hypothetical protein